MYKKAPKGWAKHWDFILLDLLIVLLSFFLAYIIRLGIRNPYQGSLYRTLAIVIFMMDVMVAVLFNTFSGVLKHGYFVLLINTLRHVILVLSFSILFTFITQTGEIYSRTVIFLTAGFHLIFGYSAKILYRRIRHIHQPDRAMFVVTTADWARETIIDLQQDITHTIKTVGIAVIDKDMKGQEIEGVPVMADGETVISWLSREWVDEIYFRIPRQNKDRDRLFSALLEMGITIHIDIGTLSTVFNQKQEVERIGKSLVLTTAINTITGLNAAAKRLLDIVGGLVGSVLALLVMTIMVVPIKIVSPGPLLYVSERIGLNGKRFKMYKIRSMIPNADEQKEDLIKDNRIRDGGMFKLAWDPRIIGNRTLPDGTHKTGIGYFLRRSSLDEMPQFFNVLKGDMSLVGTRPPTPDEWVKYDIHHRIRMATKPGITGMWQISGRSDITSFEEVVRLDMEYITRWSFGLDLRILLKTIVIVFKGKGAM